MYVTDGSFLLQASTLERPLDNGLLGLNLVGGSLVSVLACENSGRHELCLDRVLS